MQLKTYLSDKEMSVADFAKSIGHSEAAVKKWLRGERIPRREALAKIREITGGSVLPADFFGAEAA
jgi:DNA-binding transcriptional regulator YiaG